jgi:hypothetical protein
VAERRRGAPVSGRRRFLQGAAALLLVRESLAAGTLEKGVYRVLGEARINDAPARPGMQVKPGDAVVTGERSQIIFVVDRDAFLLRENARLEVGSAAATVFRIVTGALLSVFQPPSAFAAPASTWKAAPTGPTCAPATARPS